MLVVVVVVVLVLNCFFHLITPRMFVAVDALSSMAMRQCPALLTMVSHATLGLESEGSSLHALAVGRDMPWMLIII